MRSEPGAQVVYGLGRARRKDSCRQLRCGRGCACCGFEVVASEGGAGERGVCEGPSACAVLLGGLVGGTLRDGGALVGLVQVTEGVGVLAIEVGGVDEAGPFRFVGQIDVRCMALGFDHRPRH
jgi:hypothetical protein